MAAQGDVETLSVLEATEVVREALYGLGTIEVEKKTLEAASRGLAHEQKDWKAIGGLKAVGPLAEQLGSVQKALPCLKVLHDYALQVATARVLLISLLKQGRVKAFWILPIGTNASVDAEFWTVDSLIEALQGKASDVANNAILAAAPRIDAVTLRHSARTTPPAFQIKTEPPELFDPLLGVDSGSQLLSTSELPGYLRFMVSIIRKYPDIGNGKMLIKTLKRVLKDNWPKHGLPPLTENDRRKMATFMRPPRKKGKTGQKSKK